MAYTITDGLNALNNQGFFSYVLPFLIIFAVVFAILEKSRLFKSGAAGAAGTSENKGISVIIAASIGLLSLQFDVVSIFFANIFPKFGIGLAILLVVLILLAMGGVDVNGNKKIKWMAAIVAGAVVIWAILNWSTWFGGGWGIGYWFSEYFWSLIVLAIVIGAIFAMTRPSKP